MARSNVSDHILSDKIILLTLLFGLVGRNQTLDGLQVAMKILNKTKIRKLEMQDKVK